ncbi:hypothetical protein [Kitasatospora sp. HPMI-4]|uniref:hypothetical protein n=1 Tax=Kitasatospora sp. HPMI-4 TaxID=3448443 RepID=UPI003F195612
MSNPTTDPTTPPPPAPADPAPPAPATPGQGDPAAPTGDAPLGPAGEKALAEWKQRAKDAEKLARDQAARLQAFEDAQKSEAEKLADRAKAAEDRAAAATRLAVTAKVEALAASRFADPLDAVDALTPDQFIGSDGTVDTDAIEQALTGLLQRKPHWAPAPAGPRSPRPDPSQGARPGGTPTLTQQIADAEQAGDTRRAIALKTRQLRELTK